MCTLAAKDGNVRVVVLASKLDKIFTAGLDVRAVDAFECGKLTRTRS